MGRRQRTQKGEGADRRMMAWNVVTRKCWRHAMASGRRWRMAQARFCLWNRSVWAYKRTSAAELVLLQAADADYRKLPWREPVVTWTMEIHVSSSVRNPSPPRSCLTRPLSPEYPSGRSGAPHCGSERSAEICDTPAVVQLGDMDAKPFG